MRHAWPRRWSIQKPTSSSIWITDFERGSNSRLASGGAVTAAAVWSPDGTRLAFRSNRTGIIDLYERSAAGGGGDRPVLPYGLRPVRAGLIPTDWSPDGRISLLGALWITICGCFPSRTSEAGEIHRLAGRRNARNFSPDGRLVAYPSNESGRFEIYVETVPRSDRKWPVSTNGGYEPRWRADGREIYYLSGDRKLMAVPVGAGPSFGIPTPLFQTHVPAGVTSLPHALRAEPRRPAVPRQRGHGYRRVTHHCRAQLDGVAEQVEQIRVLCASAPSAIWESLS